MRLPSALTVTISGLRSDSGVRPCWRIVSSTFHGSPARRPSGVDERPVVAKPPAWATAGAVRRRSGRISRQRRIERLLVSTCTSYHRTSWRSNTPQPSRRFPACGSEPREAGERLLVVGGEDEQALAARAHRDGLAAQVADRGEVAGERQRPDVVRRAVDPDGALRVLRPVVHAVDEVPRDARAGLGDPDAGRPAPGGVARVVAGRVVDEAEALERPAEHRSRASACRPACASRCTARRGARRPRRPGPPRSAGRAATRRTRPGSIRTAPGRRWRALVQALAVPDRPPRHRHAADARRAPRTASCRPRTRRPSASA